MSGLTAKQRLEFLVIRARSPRAEIEDDVDVVTSEEIADATCRLAEIVEDLARELARNAP